MSASYRSAPEVAEIARRLIKDVPEHKPLDTVRVVYVFRDTAPRSKGRILLGKARRVTGLNAFLAGEGDGAPFFVVEISEDTWTNLTDAQRVALVDHELCHLSVDEDTAGDPVLNLRAHDLEEFAGVVARHGLWEPDVAAFGAVVEQLTLDE